MESIFFRNSKVEAKNILITPFRNLNYCGRGWAQMTGWKAQTNGVNFILKFQSQGYVYPQLSTLKV